MFDYPLPIPRNTEYDLLGIRPDARSEDIQEAKTEILGAISDKRRAAAQRLKELYAKVEGLEEAYRDVERLTRGGQEAESTDLQEARTKLARLEQKALKQDPDYLDKRRMDLELLDDLEKQEMHINGLAILGPQTRAEYDRKNPPLDLLKLEECVGDEFTDNSIMLPLLRQELSEFLASRGEEVLHPSDLTRRDFTGDFAYNPLLDGEEH